MKLIISQEGCNPITIRTAHQKTKSTESLDPKLEYKVYENGEGGWTGISDEIKNLINKNKKAIYNQILEFGLKIAKIYSKIDMDLSNEAFNGKNIDNLTKEDIAKVINTKPNERIRVSGRPKDQKLTGNSALFAIHFEWKVDPEHGAAMLFDKNAKVFAFKHWSSCWETIEDWEIKDGWALHK